MKKYPRSIQKQIDDAAAIEAQLQNPTPEPEPAPTPAPPPAPEPAVELDPPPAPPAPADHAADPEYWRRRFQTTEGLLRKEREERTREQQATQEKLSNLEKQVQQLQQLQQQAQAAVDPMAGVDLSQHFSAEQIEAHGEEHLRAVLRAAQRTLQPQLQAAVDAQLAPLREELQQQRQSAKDTQQSQANAAYQNFLADLAKEVPNWEQVNDDPRFLTYLKGEDEATGEERQAALHRFEQRRDAKRVARVFKDFLKSVGAQPPARDPTRRIQPDGSPDGGNPLPDQKPVITQAQIRQFQADIARGRYRGRAQEQAAMQKQIDEAYLAGKIG